MLAHRGCPIFMLHRILPDPATSYDPELALSVQTFERFLLWLKSEYEIVTVAELRREPEKRGRCSITFDDGWRDNFEHAYPVLQRHKIRCSIYLAVNFIGSMREMWQERLWRASQLPGFAAATLQVCHRSLAGYADARTFFLQQPSPAAEEWTARIGDALGVASATTRAFMNWEEVSQMEDLVEFGSHTVNHLLLKNSDPDTIRAELAESKAILSQRLRRPTIGVAYPWGAVNQTVCDLAGEIGYEYGLTVQRGLARPADGRFLLPRVFLSDRSLATAPGTIRSDALKLYLAYASIRRGPIDVLPPNISGTSSHPRLAHM
jgi:peptidoglycan/xylan/chitin deacetylase (PgdA/CDA1 family)